MPAPQSRLRAPTARLIGQTARAVAAAERPEGALGTVLAALLTSVGGSNAALLKMQNDLLLPVACAGISLGTTPLDEATLAHLGLTGCPLVIGGRVEGRLVVRGRRPGWLAAREARLLPLLDLAALAMRNVRVADESRLAETEIRFQAGLLNAVEHAIIASDLTGKVLYFNHVAERLYGWPASEIVGKTGLALLVPAEMRGRAEDIMVSLQAGDSWTGEFVMRRRNGTTFPVLVTDSPVRDSAGQMVGIIGVSVDITDRKRAEEALRASEDRFRQIIETAQEGVWTTDALGVTTFVNQRMADLLGYQAAQMLGRPLDDFLDDEGRAFMAANVDNRDHGRSERLDVKFIRADGTPCWAQVASNTLVDAQGHEIGALAMIADVTVRRLAEADRARLAAIVTSSEDAIYAKSLNGVITNWNRGAEHLYGYTSNEIVGHSAARLAPPERADEVPDLLKRLGRGERIEPIVTTRVRKDGSRVEVAVTISPIQDGTGRVIGAAVIARDITAERQAARERVELAREQAGRAEEERAHRREAFLAEASQRLATSLDYEATLREVAPLAVPFLSDYCVVYLTDKAGESRLVAVSHVDPSKEAVVRALHQRYVDDHLTEGGVAEVVRTGCSVMYPAKSEAERHAHGHDARDAAMLQSLDSGSSMIVPLAARGRTFGAMSFVQSVSGRGFAPDDLTLAEDLARRCAQAIDNAHLYQAAQREIGERLRIEAERAQLLKQIEQERATIAGVTASMSDGLLLLDSEGRTVYSNARAGELCGLETGLIVGQASQVAFSRTRHVYAEPDKAEALWRDALARAGDQPRFDLSLAGPPVRKVQVRLFPVAGEATSDGQVGVLLQDVTADRELQAAKDDLVSMVSHEIASPATSLVAYAELLASTSTAPPPAERQEMLASMVIEGHRLTAIIRDFLDIQRLENQRTRIVRHPSDLRPLLEHAATIARTDGDHPFVVDVPARLPLVEVDPDRVQQVLANFLSNARKYTPSGREIRLSARVVEGGVELSVADDGLGIPAESLTHLFEKFYRVTSQERRLIKGTGLGLAIAKELVEAQGGRIGVESAGAGCGSRFWFTVPLASSSVSQVDETPAPAVVRTPAPRTGQPLQVLSVDDDPMVGSTVKRVLRLDGHRVTVALSAEEALQRLETDSFDVVVSDLGLGLGLDGRALAMRVHARWPQVHFVLATGSVGIDEEAARAVGVQAFLQKPYRPQDLRDVVNAVSSQATQSHKAAA